MLLANGLSWEDALEYGGSFLRSLLNSSAIGVANARTAASGEDPGPGAGSSSGSGGDSAIIGELAACAALGAGRRMVAAASAGAGFGADEAFHGESAAGMYARMLGLGARDVPAAGSVMVMGIAELVRDNAGSQYRGRPGLLGESISTAGLGVYLIGNSDDVHLHSRPGALLAMDERGIVSRGDVGADTIVRDPRASYGMACGVERIARAVAAAMAGPDGASVAVVDFGDFARAARESRSLSAAGRVEQARGCYRRLDELLGRLFSLVGPPSESRAYIILSPEAPASAWAGSPSPTAGSVRLSSLAPVAISGWGFTSGLLTSATTRRTGIVTNLDLVPTILAGLGIEAAWPCDGAPMECIPASNGLKRAAAIGASATSAAHARGPVLRVFIGLIVAAVFAAVLATVFDFSSSRVLVGVATSLLPAVAAGPLALLACSVLGTVGTVQTGVRAAVLASVIAAAALAAFKSAANAVLAVAGATSIAIAADAVTGGTACASSLIGHSAVIGARYYGVGNELMGVLVGSVVVSSAGIVDAVERSLRCIENRRGNRGENGIDATSRARSGGANLAVAILAAVTGVFLGHPCLGANFGGMLSAFAAAIAMLAITPGRPGGVGAARPDRCHEACAELPCVSRARRRAMVIAAAIVGALALGAAMVLMDAGAGEPSHIGRAWQEIESGGPAQAAIMVVRKLQMNLRLLSCTAWTRVLIAFLLALGALAVRPSGPLLRLRNERFPLYAAFLAGLAGAGAAMAFNDSGVVACATLSMMPTLTVLGFAVDERAARW